MRTNQQNDHALASSISLIQAVCDHISILFAVLLLCIIPHKPACAETHPEKTAQTATLYEIGSQQTRILFRWKLLENSVERQKASFTHRVETCQQKTK